MSAAARRLPSAVVALTAAAGAGTVLWATRAGAGLWIDSASYIGAARQLLAGHGLTLPFAGAESFNVLAPLFALALAGLAALGLDVVEAARWLNAGLFAATILLAGGAVLRFAPRVPAAGVATALLVALSPDFVQIHQFALSEPLFLFLGLAGFVALARYLEAGRTPMLVLGAVCMAGTLLTRYAGIALIGSGALALLLIAQRPWTTRLREVALWLGVALGPSLAWGVYAFAGREGAAERSLAWHPIPLWKLATAAQVTSGWFLPPNVPAPVFLLLAIPAAALLAGFSPSVRRALGPDAQRPLGTLPWLLLLFTGVYAAFLVVVISWLDFATATNARILMPGHLALLVALMSVAARLAEPEAPRPRRVATTAAVVWMIALAAVQWPGALRREPLLMSLDYTSPAWQQSELAAAVGTLPAEARVYTNAAEAIYSLTGRASTGLPKKFLLRTGKEHAGFHGEMRNLHRRSRRGPVVFVHFATMPRGFLPTEGELVDYFSLVPFRKFSDGNIYVVDPDATVD